jgi:hypothetical protein
MNTERLERIAFWRLPVLVWLAAYAGVCAMTGSMWPWNVVVHEDGRHTLLATVFFVEHATRELIPDVLLAIAVAGAVRYYFPPAGLSNHDGVSHVRRLLAISTAAVLLGIVGGTYWTEGGQVLLDNLSQSHTRPGAPLVRGAHWRYHVIERFALLMMAFSVTGALWKLRAPQRPIQGRPWLYCASLILFVAITAVFRLTGESFRDPVFLGHQLRELFTHSLVTLPLALGTCLTLARRRVSHHDGHAQASWWPIILTGGAAVVSGTYLLVASVMTGAQSRGQTVSLARLLFPHFAEHALGYILVPILAGLLYLTPFGFGSQTTTSPPPSVPGKMRTTPHESRS